jgi:hypothetical protein
MGRYWISKLVLAALFVVFCLVFSHNAYAQVLSSPDPMNVPSVINSNEVLPTIPTLDLTNIDTNSTYLNEILVNQELGPMWPYNPIKYAIRASVASGVPATTIVLLLLLPLVAAFIAAARHLVGVRGFGIFLPAALSIVFVAIGPLLGIGLFLLIILITILVRYVLKTAKIRLQYLPRMALMLLFVVVAVLGVVFAAPVTRLGALSNVLIFPVLILVLLSEEFTKVQLGKSARVAINLTTETLLLAMLSYVLLTVEPVQRFALLNPEILILGVAVFDFFLGKFSGLRFLEYWRFRQLIKG